MPQFSNTFIGGKMKFHVKAFAAVTIAVLLPVPVFAMPERAAERKVQRILMLSPFNLSFVQYFQESVSYLDALNQANGSYSYVLNENLLYF